MKLVPTGTLYFEWTFLDETKNENGPFLDIHRLRKAGSFVEQNKIKDYKME